MRETFFFIDGANLFQNAIRTFGCDSKGRRKYPEVNPVSFANKVCEKAGWGNNFKVLYYQGMPDKRTDHRTAQMRQKHKNRSLNAGCDIYDTRPMKPASSRHNTGVPIGQKGVDTKMSIDATLTAMTNQASRIVLVTTDTDFQCVADTISQLHKNVGYAHIPPTMRPPVEVCGVALLDADGKAARPLANLSSVVGINENEYASLLDFSISRRSLGLEQTDFKMLVPRRQPQQSISQSPAQQKRPPQTPPISTSQAPKI
jgi:uncharacterized LabA/DUF88 family protein